MMDETPAKPQSILRHVREGLRRRLEFGDALFFLYVVAFVRQYVWYVAGGAAAWALTLPAALAVWYFYVAAKRETQERTPRAFWLIVALPLLFVYALRVAFPDISFDVLNYRLLHAERALNGFLFMHGDFFPSPAPYNPAPDMVTGISRHLLGYRMGTIVNYLALLWMGTILDKLLRAYITDTKLRSVAVLLVLFTEHILFQINNYMVDVLTLPLLLEATRLALDSFDGESHQRRNCLTVAFLLGASVAFKLTNLAFAIPIALVYAYKLFAARRRLELKTYLLAAATFAAPLLPFTVYIYRQTGSPVFPLYNAVFKSPYWPHINVLDPRWGPHGFVETLLWPLLLYFNTERLAEIAVYSGRISLGFVAALLCFLLSRSDSQVRAVSFVMLAGSLLWSAGSGYIRYALYLELTGGILIIWLARSLWTMNPRGSLSSPVKFILAASAACLLVAQCVTAGRYISRYEWSMRPTMFDERAAYVDDAAYLLRDRELSSFLSPGERELFADVGAWTESSFKTNGIEVLLKRDAPIVAVRMGEFFIAQESRERFAEALTASRGKRLFSLTSSEGFADARKAFKERGLGVGKVVPVLLPYFSSRTRLQMVLIEVLPASESAGQDYSQTAPRNSELPAGAFRAHISVARHPSTLRAGQNETIYVRLKNESKTVWPGTQGSWKYQLTVANRWLDARDGALVNDLDARTALIYDLPPGNEAELPLSINAPRQPGEYILELDMVQEGVTWFQDKGSPALKIKVRVE